MNDKKIITLAVILALLVIGGAWYFSKYGAAPASVLNSPTETPQIESGITFGNPDAPVTMEVYTNFLCPACARFATATFPTIKDEYVASGKVKMIFYIYPPFELSKAALCANEQNKFMEFHDYFFAHQGEITKAEDIQTFAVNSGLNGQSFKACYESDKYTEKAEKWYSEGQKREVDATPIFFINGQKFIGAQPYDEFKKIIDQKLGNQQ